ncbi:MAG: polyphosphate polymerase domain-containing protein [Nocardioides sp.]|nr:polyphosphate polymerase domain-containing protein [Nocardioides sp.]
MNHTAAAALRESAARLRSTTLAEVLAAAELQTRRDRKYLLPPHLVEALFDGLRPDHLVLEIADLRAFRYESVYFDTPELASYLRSARSRRNKFKVRTRTYLDSAECMLEVKTEGGRSETVKDRLPHPLDHRDCLDPDGAAFIDERLDLPGGAARVLGPVLTTTYSRTTLVDLDRGSRVTCDADLHLAGTHGRTSSMTDHVLIETKSSGAAGPVDRLLWRLGQRPVTISKYGVGMAALDPWLPANRWNRVLRRHFGWTPLRAA